MNEPFNFGVYLRKWLATGGGSCTATVIATGDDDSAALYLDANTEGVGPVRLLVRGNTVEMVYQIPPDKK